MKHKICVITGSPKGESSITYQTVRYLQLKFPGCKFDTIHAGHTIRQLEKDFSACKKSLENADIILFAYPVYTFLVPSQLHRFIELLKDSKNAVNMNGKSFCQISTSKHFYDFTAHNFIIDNCADLNMNNLGSLSEDMDDLLNSKGQEEAEKFWNLVLYRFDKKLSEPFNSLISTQKPKAFPKYKRQFETVKKDSKYKVCIVADVSEKDKDLKNMIDDFAAIFPHETKLVNIHDFIFQGGCLGCFNCSVSGKCIWKDGFDDFLRNEIQSCDSIIYAFKIKNHSMGSLFKTYDDRQFCNGHRTVTAGKPFGYIVHGDLSVEPNLRAVIEGRAEVGRNFLAGVATNADGIKSLSATLDYALKNKILFPANYLGEGGTRIFRDLIYIMQGFMKADHEFYKNNGLYDTLPTKQKSTIFKMKILGFLMRNKKIMKNAGNMMNKGMMMPYEKVLENVSSKNSEK
ncbi:MAG: NAD(P)H-dependent oxidoreductase [Treponema sp.]|nr:NAD(P)H-dependent oxidoreductase [Treponema sp.]